MLIKIIKSSLKYFAIIIPWFLVLGFIIFGYYYNDLPKIDQLESKSEKRVIEVKYSNKNKITTIGDLYDNQIIYNQIPKHLIEAVIATEDRKFFSHYGFDIFGIARAFIANIKAGRIVQGGSTITQQLAKLIFLNSDKTIKRKIQELLLAIKIEKIFSKEQILTLYLNRAYFGAGNYGIASASNYYFNKNISDISLNQAAMLAGLLKSPSNLAPTKNKILAENRAQQVLANMVDAGYLDENKFGVFSKKINYKTDRLQKLYFTDYIAQNFDYYLSKKQKEQKFFSITTTLDEEIQNISEDVVDRYNRNYKTNLENSQIAVIVMGKDGSIKAMIGGKNYQQSQFNRAIYSKRQPGSIFKTFIYLQAFEQGLEMDDMVIDQEIKIGNWEPKNYNNKYLGEITLKESFAKSLNSVAIQLYQNLDKDQLIKNSRKMGIFTKIDKYDPTIALGTMQTSLLELVTAFCVIANDGKGIIPYQLTKIVDKNNESLYERDSSGIGQIIPQENIYKLKALLREAVSSGTGKKSKC